MTKNTERIIMGIIGALFLLLLNGIPRAVQTDEYGEEGIYTDGTWVTRVVDGDTVKVSFSGREETVRLIGIDTPESVDPRVEVECFGKEAGEHLAELLSDSFITLHEDKTQEDTDRYGRLLRYVMLEDGTDVNLQMILDGYAYEYTYDEPYERQTEYRTAENEARDHERGLWSSETCNGMR